MKYSNVVGIVAAIAIIGVCFAPWVFIAPINTTITGMRAPNTNLGSPGLMNIVMAIAAIVFFIIPAIWAKRINLFVGAFNMAWAIRNYLLVTQCQLGECPEKKWGIYALLVLSLMLLIMALVPKVKLEENRDQ
jgi:hypothetical protein